MDEVKSEMTGMQLRAAALYFDGMQDSEIALEMGLSSASAAKQLRYRARQAMKRIGRWLPKRQRLGPCRIRGLA